MTFLFKKRKDLKHKVRSPSVFPAIGFPSCLVHPLMWFPWPLEYSEWILVDCSTPVVAFFHLHRHNIHSYWPETGQSSYDLMRHSRGLLPQAVSDLILLVLKTKALKTLLAKHPSWEGREGLISYADPSSGFLTVSPPVGVSGKWLSTFAFETSILFLQAWGFSHRSPLTYRILSPRSLKSRSAFNLCSWSFPLLELWPNLSVRRAILAVSHSFDGFLF